MHHHVPGAGELLDLCAAGAMVPMSVADQQNLGVTEAESKLFNAVSNQRDRIFQAAVDEDVAFGGRDQVRAQSLAADVVDIADDVMRRKRLCPFGIGLCHTAGW